VAKKKRQPKPKTIRSPSELLEAVTGDKLPDTEAVERVKRDVYKYTDCGAWIAFEEKGITVGSIVEGVDEGTDTHFVPYPFTLAEYDTALDEVEKEASAIWNETHGCDDCGDLDEFGSRSINPECKTCKGEGQII
jgi:hypothetical protein